ncbi:patatin-like phospholipase family protein [Methylobacterium sp. E-025]|uniref:patatin-like phospholipase family protein n=1 Tax=Methylobacterium sp. E-025 TaxID=2836561 RepID=UPI001FB89337|nr:patatin-like phospholipase family protein [Methylobacterium sp. E-025]MCJ2113766.1 patatin-like phospholipase family protein [Methylobacterium sp. E-025]
MADQADRVSRPGGVAEFTEVFAAECEDLAQRKSRLRPPDFTSTPTVKNELNGLALSGGGIRSASFSLGVMQGLNRKGIIRRIDYLSTVSGGGYIGTATTIGMSLHDGQFPFEKSGDDAGETPETRHLRDNSRYLLQGGFLGTAAGIAVYLRGLVTNAIIILPFLLLAAACLVALNPSTAELGRASWSVGSVHGLEGAIRFPLAITAAALATTLLALYAVGVSISGLLGRRVRYAVAALAGFVLCILVLLAAAEFHILALKFFFERVGGSIYATPSHSTASGRSIAQVFVEAFASSTKLVAALAPVVAVLLPFLRRIASQAVSDGSKGFGAFAKTLASRAALILVAAFLPALLWLFTMQLAFWGTAVAACGDHVAPFDDCIDVIAYGWSHAPPTLRNLFDGIAETGRSPLAGAGTYLVAALGLAAFWPFLDVNANSLHQLYRDRLGKAFLTSRKGSGVELKDDFCFSDIKPEHTPYHLINAALNVPGSAWANGRGRNAEFFIFSRRFLGSEATRYARTEDAQSTLDRFNLGTAMAISGAAAAPNMGMASMQPLSPTIALLNIRLGRWLRHPIDIALKAAAQEAAKVAAKDPEPAATREVAFPLGYRIGRWWWRGPGPWRLLREAFFKSGTDIPRDPAHHGKSEAGFVFLTDGGHIENLGIYELLKRRCRVIIAVDGEADPNLDGGSLNQIERFARIDLGTRIAMEPRPIGQKTRSTSEGVLARAIEPSAGPHVALGLIDYPAAPKGGARERGVLVYIKASITGDEANYVLAYKAKQSSFPHETTMDQLFSEEQFESYRALGEHIARRFLDGEDEVSVPQEHIVKIALILQKALPELKMNEAISSQIPK